MDKDDLLKALKHTEELAGEVAEQHDHDCPIGEVASAVRDGCREAHELLAGSGPAQVATDNYRRNWDTIFGGRQQWGQA